MHNNILSRLKSFVQSAKSTLSPKELKIFNKLKTDNMYFGLGLNRRLKSHTEIADELKLDLEFVEDNEFRAYMKISKALLKSDKAKFKEFARLLETREDDRL